MSFRLPRPKAPLVLQAALLLVWLAGCAVAPPGPAPGADGPPARVPAGLEDLPDAEPRAEPFRVGGPNKPYEVLGRRYVPFTHERPFTERGLASWYGRKFHGRSTAMGEVYDMFAMTAAHPTLPLPSYARVRNPANGREVVVRVNDRGPFHPGRIVDLSYAAALRLDLLRGVAPVELERLTPEAIRSGSWRDAAPMRTERAAAIDQVQARKEVRGVDVPAQPPSSTTAPTSRAPLPEGAPPSAPMVSVVAVEAAQPITTQAQPLPTSPDLRAEGAGIAGAAADTSAGAAPLALASATTAVVPITAQARGFWLQLGAFRQRSGAEDFLRNVAAEFGWLARRLVVFDDEPLFRLQAGPYPNRDDAAGAAERVRSAMQLVPVVIERQ